MTGALISVLILGLVAFAALNLSQTRYSPVEWLDERVAAARAFGFALILQAAHFTEELMTGFPEQFPAVFGLPAMPVSFFVAVNLLFLAIWLVSIKGLRAGSPAAFLAAWFLAIAAILNGLAHPLLAILTTGYFPGLAISPYLGGAGIWLWIQLRSATQPKSA